ncbi:MAG: ChaN family lipoprotein [Planctomycetes bacterium]|nr:ChaN family lipoprotein [Planctomycetota bacterium]
MATSRQELIAIQKRLVEELKETIYQHVGRNDPVLDRYYRDYQAEFKPGFERPASRGELVLQLARAGIAYFGDYHTLRSSQTAVLELLEEVLVVHGKKIVLCVEMLRSRDNAAGHDFVAGEFDAAEFRRRVRWTRSWNFPWQSWGRFFDFAKVTETPLFGVNIDADKRPDGLHWRDEYAADLVAAATQLYPERLVAVVYGDLHMARAHLPGAVDRRLGEFGVKRRALRVYQNSETVHWLLVERGQETVVDYVKLQRDVYCVMNATPLVKFQSFLNWQHRASEMIFESSAATDADLMEELLLDQVRGFVRTICEFLEITLEDPDNFELYTTQDLDFLDDMVVRGHYTQPEIKALKEYIAMAESAYFARAHVLYLGNFSVANAAEAAARFILAEMRPPSKEPVEARDDFYARCMVEALAFFCSKVVDHRRTPRDPAGWRQVVKQFGKRKTLGGVQKKDLAVARAYLKHKAYERKVLASGDYAGSPALYGLDDRLHVALTRALGRSLGELMYEAMSQDKVSSNLVREAMKDDVRKPDQCRNRYFQFLRLCKGVPAGTEEE